MLYQRALDLRELLRQKGHFLLGPRSTGKSFWIRRTLKAELFFDLLDQSLLRRLLARPQTLRETIAAKAPRPQEIVVIDEIQKAPELLDEVHALIEEYGLRFLLTGSSARKLKKGAANLLAGRVWMAQLFPLTWRELGGDFDLIRYLNFGGLPQIYTSASPEKEMKNYVDLYIKEEVQAEGLIRNMARFYSFFESVGYLNGEELNYQGWSSDTGIPRKTLQGHTEILRDTLIAFELPAFTKTRKRKAISRSKLYFFDVGVAAFLARRATISAAGSSDFGRAFEHFIIQECRACLSYTQKDWRLSYWRSYSQREVDLCLGTHYALEIKARENVTRAHLKGLSALREEGLFENYIVVSLEPRKRLVDGIVIWPWREFLQHLWEEAV